MKFLLNLIGITFAAALGYYFEPELRPYLTGKAPSPAPEIVATPPAVPETPAEVPAPVIPEPLEIPVAPPVETPAPAETDPAPVGDSFEPVPEPAPTPAPVEPEKPLIEPIMPVDPETPAVAGKILTPGIQAMQESIRGGQITEFSYDKVLEWNDTAEESVEGTTYQTGTVTYEAETLLGMKRMQAKAFIKDGKVTRWVGVKTGVEIK